MIATRRLHVVAAFSFGALVAGCALGGTETKRPGLVGTENQRANEIRSLASSPAHPSASQTRSLESTLDSLFSAPPLARALTAVRVTSLTDGRSIYARNADKLVIPASNMKIVTMAVAAARLGWDFRFTTRLEAAGVARDGHLQGDLIITSDGDPSIGVDSGVALFSEWAAALKAAGITQVDGRLIGDDSAFVDEPIGAGWAWDYLSAGYAAPSGALSYNENVAVVRITPSAERGQPARVEATPSGHGLEIVNEVNTSAAGTTPTLTITRRPGSVRLIVKGQVPRGGATLVRTAAIDNPTMSFVEAARLAFATQGIGVMGGAVDIDDIVDAPSVPSRRSVAQHTSEPLSSLVGYAMKVSQNFYGEMLLKAIGRTAGEPGSIERGRQVVMDTLRAWQLPAETLVMYDGSGLSRYNYVSADLLVGVLEHVWRDETLRGPFVAALPVGGRDGTLETRMRSPELDRRVQAKTGTISNVRSLAGLLTTRSGERLAFAMIANNFTASNAEVDAVMENALAVLAVR